MKKMILAQRYARALISSLEPADYGAAGKALSSFVELYRSLDDLSTLLKNPLIPLVEKTDIIKTIASKARYPREILSFLDLLVQNDRIEEINNISEAFVELRQKAQGQDTAEVASAVSLKDPDVKKLKSTLENIFNKKITIETRVDDSLIGGVMIRVGNHIIDASIRGRLNAIKQELAAI